MARSKWTRRTRKKEQICHVCLRCFYTYRDDAQFCSPRCRKAFSRSPEGHAKRLKRLATIAAKTNTDIVEADPHGLPLPQTGADRFVPRSVEYQDDKVSKINRPDFMVFTRRGEGRIDDPIDV